MIFIDTGFLFALFVERDVNHERAFSQLPPECDVQLTCTIYGYKERPFLYLPADLVRRIAAIGASLDVDTYDLDVSPS